MTAPTTHLSFPRRSDLDLHHELHARPALAARSPCVVSYWVQAGMAPERADAALAALCLSAGAFLPTRGARHHVVHTPHCVVKFERHSEFTSWQINCPLHRLPPHLSDDALRALMRDASALEHLPEAFLGHLQSHDSGRMPAAVHVVMLDAADDASLLPRTQAALSAEAAASGSDDAAPLMGAYIGDARRGALFTNMRLGRDGFTRFVVLDFGLPADQAAREAQRLCEIESYRILAMQGFPVAQREASLLARLERTLEDTVDAMATDIGHNDTQAFDTLTRLAADVEHCTARTRYRFSATRAYRAIVERRLIDLREQRIDGMQTLSGFLSRRFEPAMALCESIDHRLGDLGERINRAASLARVRVEVRREEGNQELLRALAQRQKQQLQLQQTVEGLSVVAISYYALGLVGYITRGVEAMSLASGLRAQTVVGLAAVPVVAGVALFVRRLRRHWA